jgi:hypothetical protein
MIQLTKSLQSIDISALTSNDQIVHRLSELANAVWRIENFDKILNDIIKATGILESKRSFHDELEKKDNKTLELSLKQTIAKLENKIAELHSIIEAAKPDPGFQQRKSSLMEEMTDDFLSQPLFKFAKSEFEEHEILYSGLEEDLSALQFQNRTALRDYNEITEGS